MLFDAINLVATVQGIVNRDKPRLYIDFIRNEYADVFEVDAAHAAKVSCEPDRFWFDQMRKSGGYLAGYKLQNLASVGGVVQVFRSFLKGAVVWDQTVPATMNVASTVAGVEDLLPLRYDMEAGVYDWFVRRGGILPVKRNLFGLFDGKGTIPDTKTASSGSKKCDAYLWAKALYLDTGKTNPTLMMYANDAYSWAKRAIRYPDLENIILVNRDYYIAERAFFMDLSVIEGQAPNDDPTQKPGTDYNTLCAILKKQNQLAGGEVITIGGFVPWWIKYTAKQNGTYPNIIRTEWESVYLFSQYYAQLDADAGKGLSNCSVTRKTPLKKQYAQNTKTVTKKLEKKHYICFVMTDYDSAAYLGSLMPRFWTDEKRGTLPLAWSFNSCLADRVPHVIDYMYATKSANDYFVMGDNGTGYLTANALIESGRPAGLKGTAATWAAHNQKEAKRFDLDIGGFFINVTKESLGKVAVDDKYFETTPISREFQNICSQIAPKGVGYSQKVSSGLFGSTPSLTVSMASSMICNDPGYIAGYVAANNGPSAGGSTFGMYRCTWTSPSDIAAAYDQLRRQYGDKFEAVDPYTFFALYEQAQKS